MIEQLIDQTLIEEVERLTLINEVFIQRINELKEENGRLTAQNRKLRESTQSSTRESDRDAQDFISDIRRAIQEGEEKLENERRIKIFAIHRGERGDFQKELLRSIFGLPID